MDWIRKIKTTPVLGLIVVVTFSLPGASMGQNVLPLFDTSVHAPASALDRESSDRPNLDKAAFIAQYDDGEVDVGLNLPGSAIAEYAMLFDGVGGDVSLDSVEVCFASTGAEINFRFEIVIFDDDGAGGSPGTELATFAAQATVDGGSLPDFDAHSISYKTPAGDFFIAARWNPVVYPSIVICADSDGAVQPGFLRSNETGAWSSIPSIQFPAYTALMIRAFLSTPGVVQESLYLPLYLVDRNDLLSGTTTLYALRNLLDTSTNVTIDFYTVGGVLQATENLNLGPRDTVTKNLRDTATLAVDGDGFARGWIRFSTAGFPDGTPVLSGDYFQVDPADDFATGEQLPRDTQLCGQASIRFLDFGAGTRFGFFVSSPQGSSSGIDPPTVQVTVLDEDGNFVNSSNIYSGNNAFELNATDLTTATFGTLLLDFSNAGSGYVFAEYSAENRFSVGVGSQCEGF